MGNTLLGIDTSDANQYGVWGGSTTGGALSSNHYENFGLSSTENVNKLLLVGNDLYSVGTVQCTNKVPLICVCF